MSERFYSDAKLYDRLFPRWRGGRRLLQGRRRSARRQCLGTGVWNRTQADPHRLRRHPCTGLELSLDMLNEARRKADEGALAVEWVQGDMRDFDLGRQFDLVFIAANSLLHLHEAADLLSCLRSVRAHLAPGARFVFDVFNPNLRLLAEADGVRRTRDALSFVDPDRGDVRVDVAETYDAARQVTSGTWHFSSDSEPDFVVVPLELRSIFPQELPLLLSLGGLRLVERFGDWSGRPFTGDAAIQLCVCETGLTT
jgi:SAM-dependent methyltransferase